MSIGRLTPDGASRLGRRCRAVARAEPDPSVLLVCRLAADTGPPSGRARSASAERVVGSLPLRASERSSDSRHGSTRDLTSPSSSSSGFPGASATCTASNPFTVSFGPSF
jgi:hypothetical protein